MTGDWLTVKGDESESYLWLVNISQPTPPNLPCLELRPYYKALSHRIHVWYIYLHLQ